MKTTNALPLAALLALAAAPSFAQTELPYDWSFTANAGLFTDYRFRGISQTNKQPAFQGGFDFSHKLGFYVGNWNSNVDSGLYNGANLEMDFYGGYKGSYQAFSYDAGVLYYYYPGSGVAGSTKIDNTELYVSGGWGPVSLKYSYAVSDFFGAQDSKGAYYLDGTVNFPLTKELALVGHLGYQGNLKNAARITEMDGSVQSSITDWKLGVTYDLKGWTLGASYIDTNRSLSLGTASLENKDIANSTLVLSVSKSF
ncbi:MAG TPA: TorF family putative porin [Burkholderiaceae bacterium]|nr:TorF family putative porin [Burkholderiaceae bacterium]